MSRRANSREPRQLAGWGESGDRASWWRRPRDPIGLHTLAAAALAVLAAALIGALLDPLSLDTADDIAAAERQAWQAAYERVYDAAFDAAAPEGRIDELARALSARPDNSESAWAAALLDGWARGWREAIAAMRAAAEAAGLPAGYTEFRVLDQLPPLPPAEE